MSRDVLRGRDRMYMPDGSPRVYADGRCCGDGADPMHPPSGLTHYPLDEVHYPLTSGEAAWIRHHAVPDYPAGHLWEACQPQKCRDCSSPHLDKHRCGSGSPLPEGRLTGPFGHMVGLADVWLVDRVCRVRCVCDCNSKPVAPMWVQPELFETFA